MVLPADGTARMSRQAPQPKADETRVPALDRDVALGLVHEIQMLMEPDRDRRPYAQDQTVGAPAFGLRERTGPESKTPPSGRQRKGKLRLRSTPWAFCRVSAATPSGFRSGTIQTSTSGGGRRRSSCAAIAIPAGSLPWIQPTTSRCVLVSRSPTREATMGLPSTLCPTVRARVGSPPHPVAIRASSRPSAPARRIRA